MFQQPLLRNFQIDQIRQQVALSKKVRDLSDIKLDSVVTQTLRNVRNAYWDLSYSINNLKAQQESLALSRQSLKDNQKRVEIGTMAPIDIVQAQAEVATNESSVIVAEAAIKQAQDNLRALILDPATPDFWNVAFEPSDARGVRRARHRSRRRGAQRDGQAVGHPRRQERARAERHQHQVLQQPDQAGRQRAT